MANYSDVKKRTIFNKCNGKCAYCGCNLSFFEMTIDHIKPKISGGRNNIENLNPSCRSCNSLKSHMSVKKFTVLVKELIKAGQYRIYFDNQISKSVFYFKHLNFVRYSASSRSHVA